ncbi:hypothetical protein CsSME_00044249 [Camellia sinensis var. sinensis]
MKQLVVELNDKNAKLVDQLEEYAVHEYTQAATGVQDMKQSHPNMYHYETNILDIMPLLASSPADMNKNAELRGVDSGITTVLQNSLVRNIKNKNRKQHKLPEYESSLVLGRLKKLSDGGVVNVGECAHKHIMYDDIIEVDDLAKSERTFSRFDLTNRMPIWKLLSTKEKDKLKETYEKCGDSVQVWTG